MSESITKRIGELAMDAVYNEVLEIGRAPDCAAESAERCLKKIAENDGPDAAWAITAALVQAAFSSGLFEGKFVTSTGDDEEQAYSIRAVTVEIGARELSLYIEDPQKSIGEFSFVAITQRHND